MGIVLITRARAPHSNISVKFGQIWSIWSNLVHFGPSGPIRSILIHLVCFGPLQFIQSILVHFGSFSPISLLRFNWSTSIHLIQWSNLVYLVHFGLIGFGFKLILFVGCYFSFWLKNSKFSLNFWIEKYKILFYLGLIL